MSYKRSLLTGGNSLEGVKEWVDKELLQIEKEFLAQEFLYLAEKNVAPAKPIVGMTVLADGVNWNPGGGQGVYTYYAGTWNKLG